VRVFPPDVRRAAVLFFDGPFVSLLLLVVPDFLAVVFAVFFVRLFCELRPEAIYLPRYRSGKTKHFLQAEKAQQNCYQTG
jgi:hypothetical protein